MTGRERSLGVIETPPIVFHYGTDECICCEGRHSYGIDWKASGLVAADIDTYAPWRFLNRNRAAVEGRRVRITVEVLDG